MKAEDKEFALELATALDDMKSLAWHQGLVRMYRKSFLQDMLWKSLLASNIGNRAALFNTLIKTHGSTQLIPSPYQKDLDLDK